MAAVMERQMSNAPEFSLDVLGQLVAVGWCVECGDRLPDWCELRMLFINGWDEMPPSMKALLHVERRVTGDVLREETALMLAAQRSGVVSRLNYSVREQVVRTTLLQALDRLYDIEMDFPDEVAWLRTRISALAA